MFADLAMSNRAAAFIQPIFTAFVAGKGGFVANFSPKAESRWNLR
jgi:hypothetical protein